MSPSIKYPGTHFSEIMAERLGYELISYSRAGMSNGGIAIQIDTAIEEKPDLILVGTTYSDRIEFPVNVPKPTEKFRIDDILYHQTHDSKNAHLISTNLYEIISNDCENTFEKCIEPDKKEKAIKNWFRYLYHPDWKKQVDRWMMYAILHKLHLSGIPNLLCVDRLNVVYSCPWLLDSFTDDLKTFLVSDVPTNLDPGYHTTLEEQQLAAEYILKHMRETMNV